MQQVLLEKLLKNVVKVEITREAGADSAVLTISNDVKMEGEVRERGRKHTVRTVNIPDSAHAFFEIMKAKLADAGFKPGNEQLINLPKMAKGAKDFSATATLEVGNASDDQLRRQLDVIYTAAEQRMAAARYNRKAGKWSDRQAGNAADTIDL